MDLTGRVALVTASKRLGRAVALGLAGAGADVACVYRSSPDDAQALAAAVQALGRRSVAVHADVTSAQDCAHAVETTAATLGRLDVLVNVASRYVHTPFDQLTVADWDDQMAVDLRATWLCSHAAVPHLRRRSGGHIVNVADWVAASRRPRYEGFLPYYVAKAGVIALTEALALELAPDGILVNAIAPGPILAPEAASEEERRAVERATPLGRWGGEAAMVTAVLSLLASDFITGETIRVDGGRHLR